MTALDDVYAVLTDFLGIVMGFLDACCERGPIQQSANSCVVPLQPCSLDLQVLHALELLCVRPAGKCHSIYLA